MKYYKHSQLVREYGVSDKTIRNWVEASLEGKIDLKLHENKGRYYVADSVANNAVLANLAEHGKKYRNGRSSKVTVPKPEFYEIVGSDNVPDFVNTLEKQHELSWHYSYFGAAAKYWDDYLMEQHAAGPGNLVTNTIDALKTSFPYIESLIAGYERVNVVNVCAANSIALHDMLGKIKATGKLNRFVAVDISLDMLNITANNVDRWFGGAVATEKVIADVRNQPLYSLVGDTDASTINLFFMVAGPLVNFEDAQRVLSTISGSMSQQDLFITTTKRDTAQTRNYYDFNVRADATLLGFNSQYLLDLLNIEPSFYEVEQAYDKYASQKVLKVRLKVNVAIEFSMHGIQRTVELEKNDSILMWRAKRYSDEELVAQLSSAGFSQLLFAQSPDQELRLTISRPKSLRKDPAN